VLLRRCSCSSRFSNVDNVRQTLLADQTTGAVLARVDQAVERFGRSVSAAIGLPWYVQHATGETETWHTRVADSARTPGQATLPKRF